MKYILVLTQLVVIAISVNGNPAVRENVGGWGSPSTGSPSEITADASLSANGPGWAAATHGDNIQGSGVEQASGGALLEENGTILQLSGNNPQSAEAVQSVTVDNFAAASEGLAAHVTGPNASAQHSGWSAAAGQGASSADGHISIIVSS